MHEDKVEQPLAERRETQPNEMIHTIDVHKNWLCHRERSEESQQPKFKTLRSQSALPQGETDSVFFMNHRRREVLRNSQGK